MHIIHLWACKRQEGNQDQHRFTKAKPTWPTWSLSMTKWWTGKVNGNSSCNLYSTKAFGNAFPHILVAEKLWWDKQSFKWAEKWLQHWVPRQYSMAWGVTVGNEKNTLGMESSPIFPPGWWSRMFPQTICWKTAWHIMWFSSRDLEKSEDWVNRKFVKLRREKA